MQERGDCPKPSMVSALTGALWATKFAPGEFVEPCAQARRVLIPVKSQINEKARTRRAFSFIWRPLGDSNPCCRRERAVS